MNYTSKAWRPVHAEEFTITEESRPHCAGGIGTGCVERPNHVIVYLVNDSGLPGVGKQRVRYACYRHLHSNLVLAEGVATFATVSAYKGV
ncbi:hypothetical protein [Streptomyces sp. NPDC059009]|uniref:hypothetical protein n=1 Tax=Streptomyces sp. NPDC059009 TaxID=3346694 RepID=UPI00368D6504